MYLFTKILNDLLRSFDMLDAKGYPKMPNSWGKTLPWEAIYFSEKIRWCLLNMILCLMTQIQWKFQSDTALKWRRWPNKNKPLYIWFITAPKDTETCKINVNPPQDWKFQFNARYNIVKIGQNWTKLEIENRTKNWKIGQNWQMVKEGEKYRFVEARTMLALKNRQNFESLNFCCSFHIKFDLLLNVYIFR